jgi:hypothetical protein
MRPHHSTTYNQRANEPQSIKKRSHNRPFLGIRKLAHQRRSRNDAKRNPKAQHKSRNDVHPSYTGSVYAGSRLNLRPPLTDNACINDPTTIIQLPMKIDHLLPK